MWYQMFHSVAHWIVFNFDWKQGVSHDTFYISHAENCCDEAISHIQMYMMIPQTITVCQRMQLTVDDGFNPYSARMRFWRHNLTSIDVRIWRLNSIPVLSELKRI